MMKNRAASVVLFGLGTAFLFGCPIYSEDGIYYDGSCWDGQCYGVSCSYDDDCPPNYVCGSDRYCHATDSTTTCSKPSDCSRAGTTGTQVSATCGSDNRCHSDDCSTVGCPSSYVCRLSSGVPACVPASQNPGGGDAGVTSDCRRDSDCPSPVGSKCLTGKCVAPQDQCADATQCTGGAQCVNGSCTPSCNDGTPCPTGYACDTTKGVCTTNPQNCSDTSQCSGGTVCSQEHCVKPCNTDGSCSGGLVCVDGGCVPDEKPVFTCNADGTQDNCQAGSICLRHSCYIGCDADAGAEACKSADAFNQCKPVTTGSGTYNVCGSTNNLGTECDPTQSKNCSASLICIDGFCK